jgi:hypothetical protein
MIKTETFLTINAIYIVPAILLSSIVFLIFRVYLKTKTWYLLDVLTVLLPGILYAILDISNFDRFLGHAKALGNIISEPIILGISCGIVFFLRSIGGRKFPQYTKKLSCLSVIVMLVLTVSIYVFMPDLQE